MPSLEISSFDNFSNLIKSELEMAKLLYSNGNFSKSLTYFEQLIKSFKENEDYDNYMECYRYIFRILNEFQDFNKIKQYSHEMEELVHAKKLSQYPRVLATSSYYSIYVDKDFEKAKQLLNSSLKNAFDRHDQAIKQGDAIKQNQSRYEIIYCLYYYAGYYYENKDYENCLQELKNLNILIIDYLETKNKLEKKKESENQVGHSYDDILQSLDENLNSIQQLKLGSTFLRILIQMSYQQKYEEAEKLLWKLYDEANRMGVNYFTPYIYTCLSWCHFELGDKKQALMFFNLAKKNTNPERKLFFSFLEAIKIYEKLDDMHETSIHDIVFDYNGQVVLEKQKGFIEFKNQFILLDLFKLFALNQGVAFSKEDIIKKVWKQDYLPEYHDNKIYVTIKRLREMIEGNSCKPVYIRRNSSGYYFSPTAKVLIKQKTRSEEHALDK